MQRHLPVIFCVALALAASCAWSDVTATAGAPAAQTLAPLQSAPQGYDQTIEIPADTAGGVSSLPVHAGQTVTIAASGQWSHGVENTFTPYYGPNGYPRTTTPDYPLPGANVGALICRVGGGQWFTTGASTTFVAQSDGTLQFAMNDLPTGLSGHSGSLKVTVHLQDPAAPTDARDVNNTFLWTDVSPNHYVPIVHASFDEGGYQLYGSNGEVILVPFKNHNLYVMKFGRTDGGTMTFMNSDGATPVLFLPPHAYLDNATVPGARWYPLPSDYHPSHPVCIALALDWGSYRDMRWYRDMHYHGGYRHSTRQATFVEVVGTVFVIGLIHYLGWAHYHDYAQLHATPYHLGYRYPGIYRTVAHRDHTVDWHHRYVQGHASTGGSGIRPVLPPNDGLHATTGGSGIRTITPPNDRFHATTGGSGIRTITPPNDGLHATTGGSGIRTITPPSSVFHATTGGSGIRTITPPSNVFHATTGGSQIRQMPKDGSQGSNGNNRSNNTPSSGNGRGSDNSNQSNGRSNGSNNQSNR